MREVLVTGANGHVGYNLVKLLVQRGYAVRAGVRGSADPEKTRPLKDLGAQIVETDLMQPDTLRRAIDGCEGLFQVAAVYRVYAENPQRDIIAPAVEGGMNALVAAKAAGVKRVVFTSSVAAVGAAEGRAADERDWNEAAMSPYTIAKTVAEKKAWDYARDSGLDLVAINPSAIIGPGFFRNTPSTTLCELLIRGRLPAVPPIVITFVDVRDVAMAHILAYETPAAKGRYLATDARFKLIDLMKVMKEIDPTLKTPSLEIPAAMMPLGVAFDWLGNKLFGQERALTRESVRELLAAQPTFSSARLRTELGWQPMDFKQSMVDTLDWVRKVIIK